VYNTQIYWIFGLSPSSEQWTKSRNSVILSVIHHRPNPLESAINFRFDKGSCLEVKGKISPQVLDYQRFSYTSVLNLSTGCKLRCWGKPTTNKHGYRPFSKCRLDCVWEAPTDTHRLPKNTACWWLETQGSALISAAHLLKRTTATGYLNTKPYALRSTCQPAPGSRILEEQE
jgi:hypothetical protein